MIADTIARYRALRRAGHGRFWAAVGAPPFWLIVVVSAAAGCIAGEILL